MAGYEILIIYFSEQQMFSKASNIFRKPTKKTAEFQGEIQNITLSERLSGHNCTLLNQALTCKLTQAFP